MGKFLIPLAVLLFGFFGYKFYKKTIAPKKEDKKEIKAPPPASAPKEAAPRQPDNVFTFMEGDPWLSTPDAPYSAPNADFTPGRPTSAGFVQSAKDGVAKIVDQQGNKFYIVTDTTRPTHKKIKFNHIDKYKGKYYVYCNLDESLVGEPGLYVGKDVGYGKVTKVTPFLVRIDRHDKGFTLITNTMTAPDSINYTDPTRNEADDKDKEEADKNIKEIETAKTATTPLPTNSPTPGATTTPIPSATPTAVIPIISRPPVIAPISKPKNVRPSPPARPGGVGQR
jgi:hypothetical protein